MSLRHLKKVFDSEDLLPAPAPASSDEENELEIRPADRKSSKKKAGQKARNKFELLMEMNGEQDDEGAEAADDNEAPDSGEESGKKSIRKKPKKKKKKKQNQAPDTVNQDPAPSCSGLAIVNRMDQKTNAKARLDDVLEEFELTNEEREAIVRRSKLEELFAIDPKLLNPENELKKIFGSKVIKHERSGGTRFHNSNQHRRNLLSRRARLVYPKEQRIFNGASGIMLELLSTDERTGYKTFKFSHSQGYKDVQRLFLDAVNTYNPDSIVNLMRAHPYHIDAHIQLSDMAKHSEDMQIASELVEDGINYLQNAFDCQFDICSPSCQMPYKYQENRALHILLFKYLVFLGQRGCPHTALQLCKRLLSLDPDIDPLCVTLMIDFYALKSKEFAWLCDLYEACNAERNLNQLPNWAYSIALAYFMRRNDAAADSRQQTKASNSKTSTSDKDGDWEAKSNELLQYALLMFPSVLLPLLEKCGIQSDSKVINHWYFISTASSKQTKALNLLCDLYVWRTHHLWRDATILRWLEFNTQAVIGKIDQDKKITNGFAQKRQRRYAGTPYNILRHVIVTDSKDITIPLPQELSKKPVLSFDPIRPHNAMDIYNYDQPDPTRPAVGEATNNGLLSMLFRSLVFDLNAVQGEVGARDGQGGQGRLVGNNNWQFIAGNDMAAAGRGPGVDAQEGAGAAAGEENANAGGARAGIHDSVNTLLSAMRDLLQVVTPAGIGGAPAAAGDEDSSEDDSDQD